jgi:hypothetical protein
MKSEGLSPPVVVVLTIIARSVAGLKVPGVCSR